MIRKFALILAMLSLSAAAGCAGSQTAETTPEPEPTPEPAPAPVEPAADEAHLEGSRLVIPRHIHFASDSDVILEDSYSLLDSIVALLRRNTAVTTLHVTGHTDLDGDAAHNMDLSERRAAAVVAALRERGLTVNMDSQGRGETEPVCQETTPECNERNRRVEFVVEAE